jgi:hypothetical protein
MKRQARESITLPHDVGSFIRGRVRVLVQEDRAIIDLICDGYIQGMTDLLALQARETGHG